MHDLTRTGYRGRGTMTRWTMVAAVAVLAGCAGSGTQQLCKDAAEARCSKLFECYTSDAERMALMLGTSTADCTTKQQALCDPTTDGGLSTSQCPKATPDAGARLYDTEAASTCITQFKALKCDAVRAGTFPPSCSNICK